MHPLLHSRMFFLIPKFCFEKAIDTLAPPEIAPNINFKHGGPSIFLWYSSVLPTNSYIQNFNRRSLSKFMSIGAKTVTLPLRDFSSLSGR
jgi:hypothetical protein